jgi:hypothetical protein
MLGVGLYPCIPDTISSATLGFSSFSDENTNGQIAFSFEVTFKDGKLLKGSVSTPSPQWNSDPCAEGPVSP